MGSTRLPGKSLLPLAGEPLVGRLLERVKRAKLIDHIVLAVPDTPENYVLRDLGYKHGVYVYAGSENNLVDRYYFAAKNLDTNYVVRIPADNPTPEPDEIDRIITHQFKYCVHFKVFIFVILDVIDAPSSNIKSLLN